jgi:hypothetical protein
MSTASLGGSQAEWRTARTIESKHKLLQRFSHHILLELRRAKTLYINDHDLLLSIFDRVLDSGGLFTLLLPYNYYRLYWFFIIYLEITIYGILGGILNIAVDWITKCYIFIIINIIFGIITYIYNPFTEEKDKWIDFLGRILITIIIYGTIICSNLTINATNYAPHSLYEPWNSFDYLMNISKQTVTLYLIIDIFMVLLFYFYIIYILYMIGFFGAVERIIQNFQFGFHDHILDFLVEKLDERKYGMENIFTGLQFIQQWDDIIHEQRRHALMKWPDVRPSNLITFSNKCSEITWASMFNLNINNIRSSLGLTLLHAVMFSANGDVARWIIHRNPNLLLIEDAQSDTPITIALKECSYFLLAFGELNNGYLDDGTSYSDESYSSYYPEVDEYRDEIFADGEFLSELSTIQILNSNDILKLQNYAIYDEPREDNNKEFDPKKIKFKLDIYGNRIYHQDDIALLRKEKKKKLKQKALLLKQQKEKTSVFKNRFPEDLILDDYETGQMSSWNVIDINVPDENVYLDSLLIKKMVSTPTIPYPITSTIPNRNDNNNKTNENFRNSGQQIDGIEDFQYNDLFLSFKNYVNNMMIDDEYFDEDDDNNNDEEHCEYNDENNNNNDIEKGIIMTKKKEYLRLKKLKLLSDKLQDLDIEYIIQSCRKHHYLKKELIVPFTHESISTFHDWNINKKKRKNNRKSINEGISNAGTTTISDGNSSYGGSDDNSRTIEGEGNNSTTNLTVETESIVTKLLKRHKHKTDREVRWKICQFAEILLSDELASYRSKLKWKLSEFKKFSRLASQSLGKTAQNLVLVCNLNCPKGFVRVSDWSLPHQQSLFDIDETGGIHMIIKGVVTIVSSFENVSMAAIDTLSNPIANIPLLNNLSSSSSSKSSRNRKKRKTLSLSQQAQQHDQGKRMFSDRIIQYFAEALVSCTKRIDLDDSELSYNGRIGWRAIARALRRTHCAFIIPSLFVSPKKLYITHLILSRNELDCGDAVYLSDIFTHQLHLIMVDLSFNRIGARGMSRMCIALRDHPTIEVFKVDHNIIGTNLDGKIDKND